MSNTSVSTVGSIAEAPKDGQWYQIPSDENSNQFIKWNGKSQWQCLVLTASGQQIPLLLDDDGAELVNSK